MKIYREYRRIRESNDLKDILDVPILFLENGYFCYTDLEAAKQFFRDMYTENHQDDEMFLKDQLEYIDEQTLDSFADFSHYTDWGANTFLWSIRETIAESRIQDIITNPKDIYYKNGYIYVPIIDMNEDDAEWEAEDLYNENLFSRDSCIGEKIQYDSSSHSIMISANFSGLNSGYYD